MMRAHIKAKRALLMVREAKPNVGSAKTDLGFADSPQGYGWPSLRGFEAPTERP
jgi:hypothetical protein